MSDAIKLSNKVFEDKKALEDRLDSLESWEIAFTYPVAIGLILEFYAAFALNITAKWNACIDRSGLLLVTIGVVAELIIERKIHRANRQLRDADAEIDRRAQAELKAKDEQIAELNLARAKIESALADRKLTPDQVEFIRSSIDAFTGQRAYITCCEPETSESTKFAGWLFAAISTKWSASNIVDNRPPSRLPVDGVHVFSTPDFDSMQAAASLTLALMKSGVETRLYTQNTHPWIINVSQQFSDLWPLGLWDAGQQVVLIVVADKPPHAKFT